MADASIKQVKRSSLGTFVFVTACYASAWAWVTSGDVGAIAATPLGPKPIDALIQQGMDKLARKDYKGAIGFASRAIRLDKKNPEALFLCGEAHGLAGDSKHGIDDFNEAIAINPRFVSAYLSRAQLLELRSDLMGAMVDYDRAIELQPDYAMAYYLRGKFHQRSEAMDRAMADLTRAIELQPNYVEAVVAQAELVALSKR
jgi:tetratricopeptide (TPR) repeat protein